MKNPADNVTRDLIDSPRRGRPVTGKAKTKAQIQKEYRARQKRAGGLTVSLSLDELDWVITSLLYQADSMPIKVSEKMRDFALTLANRAANRSIEQVGPRLSPPAKVDPFED
jgi:hypothetical protein